MSANNGEEETKAAEIIIKRGGHGGEDGHHGGVWKIAYADFMTAMMAFFLVMWLINSSDKKTVTQVATYFNPLRLTDKSASSKGLHEAHSVETTAQGDEVQSTGTTAGAKSEKNKKETKGDPKGRFNDEAIFQDPLSILDKIAQDAKEQQTGEPKSMASEPSSSANSELLRDPFDPGFRQQVEVIRKGDNGEGTGPHNEKSEGGLAGDAPDKSKQGGVDAGTAQTKGGIGDLAEKKLGAGDADAPRIGKGPEAKEVPPQPKLVPKAAEKKDAKAAMVANAEKSAAEEVRKIDREIKQIERALAGALPNIEVTNTDEGILISVTDGLDFGMFAVSSAEPEPKLVLVMEKLAQVLAAQREPIVVRGHTDGRPYKGGRYDNWRLSTARAHMAYYMLLRGGIDEKRFERVEGYADKRLRVPQDPLAAPNRRIELLLRRSKPT